MYFQEAESCGRFLLSIVGVSLGTPEMGSILGFGVQGLGLGFRY